MCTAENTLILIIADNGHRQQEQIDLSKAFDEFAVQKSSLWDPPRSKDELTISSGSIDWPLAHHLHNPSFSTLTPHEPTTADASNPCTWQIMGNSREPQKTSIFDFLARREVDDEFAHDLRHILSCDENWLAKIR